MRGEAAAARVEIDGKQPPSPLAITPSRLEWHSKSRRGPRRPRHTFVLIARFVYRVAGARSIDFDSVDLNGTRRNAIVLIDSHPSLPSPIPGRTEIKMAVVVLMREMQRGPSRNRWDPCIARTRHRGEVDGTVTRINRRLYLWDSGQSMDGCNKLAAIILTAAAKVEWRGYVAERYTIGEWDSLSGRYGR